MHREYAHRPVEEVEHVTLVDMPLRDGGSVVVEVDGAQPPGPVTRGGRREEFIVEAGQTLEDALDRVAPAFRSLVDRLHALAEHPDEINVQFGLRINTEVGAIIARTSGEANFTISLRWTREEPKDAGV
jgi:Trypsin-co-occurring domain 1